MRTSKYRPGQVSERPHSSATFSETVYREKCENVEDYNNPNAEEEDTITIECNNAGRLS